MDRVSLPVQINPIRALAFSISFTAYTGYTGKYVDKLNVTGGFVNPVMISISHDTITNYHVKVILFGAYLHRIIC